jgi:hypothetical protein
MGVLSAHSIAIARRITAALAGNDVYAATQTAIKRFIIQHNENIIWLETKIGR